MRDWKERFRQTAAEFVQRKYDEEHGYVSISMDPPEPMSMASVILMLPVGIFLFFNGIALLTSGFKRLIRFFPDNLIMILLILAAVVVVILLKIRDARKLREYNAEKNRLADLKKALDDLAKDHPEVPRWWHDTTETKPGEYKASGYGKIRHTSLEYIYFFLNKDQEEADVSAEQVKALLAKKDRFFILTEGGDADIRDGGTYRICQAQVTLYGKLGILGDEKHKKQLSFEDYKFMPRSFFDRMCRERDRQTSEYVRYIDDISPKDPGQPGLSKNAMDAKREMEQIDEMVKTRFKEHFPATPEQEDKKYSQYDVIQDCCILGYAVYEAGNTKKPVAYALYRNPGDVRFLRLYMHGSVKMLDPHDPKYYQKMFDVEDAGDVKYAYNFVVGSFEQPLTESGWKSYLRHFLKNSCGWIGTDFSEQPRWGLDRGDWAAFILSHVNHP